MLVAFYGFLRLDLFKEFVQTFKGVLLARSSVWCIPLWTNAPLKIETLFFIPIDCISITQGVIGLQHTYALLWLEMLNQLVACFAGAAKI